MTRSRIAASSLSLALAVSGCTGADAPRPTTGTPPATQPDTASPATAAPSTGQHGESRVAAGVSFDYQTLAQFIRDNSQIVEGVAVVTVESVSPLRWNTPDGKRPSEPALHADWSSTGDNRYGIGRAYGVRLQRVAWGKWLAPGPTEVYWLGGGKLGADEDVNGSADLLPPPVVGGTAVVLVGRFYSSPGVVGPTISWPFPVDANGRVITLDPTEDITLADLDQHLP